MSVNQTRVIVINKTMPELNYYNSVEVGWVGGIETNQFTVHFFGNNRSRKVQAPIRFEMKSKHTKSAWFQRGAV